MHPCVHAHACQIHTTEDRHGAAVTDDLCWHILYDAPEIGSEILNLHWILMTSGKQEISAAVLALVMLFPVKHAGYVLLPHR